MSFEEETRRKEQWLEREADRGMSFEIPRWVLYVALAVACAALALWTAE